MEKDEGVQAWFEKAEEDLVAARLLHDRLPAIATFHAQQAAEKAIKGLRMRRGLRLDKTHDLDLLLRDLKPSARIAEHAALLSTYYISTRYPEMPAAPTVADAQDAVRRAEEVMAWCRSPTS